MPPIPERNDTSAAPAAGGPATSPLPRCTRRLLVSVRSVSEAIAALRGGCDLVDVKEPSRGSLGMADIDSIADVVRIVRSHAREDGGLQSSAALGELVDRIADRDVPRLPEGLDFVKLGMSQLRSISGWKEQVRAYRERVKRAARGRLQWIAVAYADFRAARSPAPVEIVLEAADAGCAGVLFDTFRKDGKSLLDWLPPDELTRLVERTVALGLSAALAGAVDIDHLPKIACIPADIVAVRSAVCVDGERRGSVSSRRVRRFCDAMAATFPARPVAALQARR